MTKPGSSVYTPGGEKINWDDFKRFLRDQVKMSKQKLPHKTSIKLDEDGFISTAKTLPKTGEWVEIKLPDGTVLSARIIENEFNEMVWKSWAGSVGFVMEYTKAQLKGLSIKTKPKMPVPVGWRKIK